MAVKRYFGTDGIRGRVGETPVSADFMLRLGRAAGTVLKSLGGDGSVVIGKDTRLSGYMFESALEAGLIAAGADVRLLGPMPTPAVAQLTLATGASAGIVISASHNPHHDNGIKFFSAAGEKLSDDVEVAIEDELERPFTTVDAAALGKATRLRDAHERYLDFVRGTVPPGFDLDGVRLVVDCANGANYRLGPQLFERLGAMVIAIGHEPDGLNINDGCGSMHPEALAARVVAERADVGIAFDGDGDRVLLVDATGHVLDGDDLLFLLARDRAARGELAGPVVGTLMTNFGLELAFGELGIPFLRANVGDRFVHRMLVESGGVLGGEASGHILVLDRASTGDALVSALAALEVWRRCGDSLSALRSAWTRLTQRTRNVRIARGAKPLESPVVAAARARAEGLLAGRGRLVLRPSGTEPVVRVTVEAEDPNLVDLVLVSLGDAVESAA
jgi:phosphoglucosamine mutase